jgi:2-succinyl-5-enolpyruvyl-6-hydroxy-3-cyclohexene-1-carboxylate synthase
MNDKANKQPASVQTAELVVQQLVNTGVEFVALAPGSRNGPISLALVAAEKQGLLSVHVRIDERSAAFLALGAAIRTGKPTAVLTTSGTAVANVFPAIVEAKYAGIPFIVLTADRPASVQGTGANQVIVQREIFGNYVSRSIEIASDSLTIETTSAREAIRDRINSVLSAATRNRSPVHLNIGLAEPLVPVSDFVFEHKKNLQSETVITPENISTEFLTRKGLIVAGGTNIEYLNYAQQLGEALDWPVIVEPPHIGVGAGMVSHPSTLLSLNSTNLKPEVVLTVGRVGLSRQVNELVKKGSVIISCAVPSIVTNSPAKQRISGLFRIPAKQNNKAWKQVWDAAGKAAHQIVQKVLNENKEISALHVIDSLMKNLPSNSHLHLASSLTARDFELLNSPELNSPFSLGQVSVSMNRGVNGIDGVAATAMGTALSAKTPTYAVLGDIAALHDLSSFAIPSLEAKPDITFVITDNNGGAIFSLLEQSEVKDFERVFGTPTDVNLLEVFKSLGAEVKLVSKISELEQNLGLPKGIKVIVVKINSRTNEAMLRKQIFEEVNRVVKA